MGIQHDVADDDGAVWLKIDRLPRIRPPEPSGQIKQWLTVPNHPSKPPQAAEARIERMPRAAAQELVEWNIAAPLDVMDSPQGGPATVDVRLRLDRHPDVQQAIEQYINGPYQQWVAKEKPRRETIAIYDKFFSVAQSIKDSGAEDPTEVVLGVGMALWRTEP